MSETIRSEAVIAAVRRVAAALVANEEYLTAWTSRWAMAIWVSR